MLLQHNMVFSRGSNYVPVSLLQKSFEGFFFLKGVQKIALIKYTIQVTISAV